MNIQYLGFKAYNLASTLPLSLTAFFVFFSFPELGIEPSASQMLGKQCAHEHIPRAGIHTSGQCLRSSEAASSPQEVEEIRLIKMI